MLALLGALIAVGPLSIDMYLPAFPAVEAALGVSQGSAEFTLAAFFIGITLGQAAYGPLSDRFGRRKPLLAGLALYTFASVGCALAGSPRLGRLALSPGPGRLRRHGHHPRRGAGPLRRP